MAGTGPASAPKAEQRRAPEPASAPSLRTRPAVPEGAPPPASSLFWPVARAAVVVLAGLAAWVVANNWEGWMGGAASPRPTMPMSPAT